LKEKKDIFYLPRKELDKRRAQINDVFYRYFAPCLAIITGIFRHLFQMFSSSLNVLDFFSAFHFSKKLTT